MKQLVFILILFIACAKDEPTPSTDTNCRENFTCTYEFMTNSQLVINNPDGFPTYQPGDDLVFVYSATYNDEPGIADDELTERIFFQVDHTNTSFTYNLASDELVYYTRLCFCGGPEMNQKIQKGSITGTKISDQGWKLTGEVFYNFGNQERSLKFKDTLFIKK